MWSTEVFMLSGPFDYYEVKLEISLVMLLHSDTLACLDAVLGVQWNHRCGMRISAELIHV